MAVTLFFIYKIKQRIINCLKIFEFFITKCELVPEMFSDVQLSVL
tara:strand:+ start:569 stop:703 length:135 start_codon:yes stop_codon:yes gene_type:complete